MKHDPELRSSTSVSGQTVTTHGQRLDQFLQRYITRRSREKIKVLIASGDVRVTRVLSYAPLGRLRPSTLLLPGDRVELVRVRRGEPEVSFDYSVLFEDDGLMVINKPGNLPVHPAGSFFFNTLTMDLQTRGLPAYPVHRLDRETSGVIVIAKSASLCRALVAQFSDRTTQKTYLAVVRGRPTQERFSVDAPLGRDPASRINLKMGRIEIADGGQEALTEFRVLGHRRSREHGPLALVECRPKTGRQHQIRVHLALQGLPILGDKLYGVDEETALSFFERTSARENAEFPRHALHAYELQFDHPVTGERMKVRAPWPEDLAGVMAFPRDGLAT